MDPGVDAEVKVAPSISCTKVIPGLGQLDAAKTHEAGVPVTSPCVAGGAATGLSSSQWICLA
jgi:hypothetical protein